MYLPHAPMARGVAGDLSFQVASVGEPHARSARNDPGREAEVRLQLPGFFGLRWMRQVRCDAVE
jgi:hypothetical protein